MTVLESRILPIAWISRSGAEIAQYTGFGWVIKASIFLQFCLHNITIIILLLLFFFHFPILTMKFLNYGSLALQSYPQRFLHIFLHMDGESLLELVHKFRSPWPINLWAIKPA